MIHLNAAQVNMLSHLAEWTVTSPASVKTMTGALADVLGPQPGAKP